MKKQLPHGARLLKPMLMLFLLTMLPASAFAGTIFTYTYKGQEVTYEVLDENAKTVKTPSDYNDNKEMSGVLELPAHPKNGSVEYTLTEIEGFFNIRELTSVILPNTVTRINDGFSNCRALSSVTFPESLTGIYGLSFRYCTGLLSLTFPESLIEINRIGSEAVSSTFEGCTNLTSVSFGNSLKVLNGFNGCSALTSVTVPNSVTTIGGFCKCTSLQSLTIPDSVIKIISNSFKQCTGLKTVTIGNSVTYLSAVFSKCTGLTNITFGNSLIKIEGSSFSECTSLSSITFPESLTTILAFDGCTALTSVTFPESLTSLSGFSLCTALTSVKINSFMKNYRIGGDCFWKCPNLKNIVLAADGVYSIDEPSDSEIPADASIFVPQNLLEDYKTKNADRAAYIYSIEGCSFKYDGEEFGIGLNDAATLSVSLDNATIATGFQLDITLPAGLTIASKNGKPDVSLGAGCGASSHVLSAAKVSGENRYRIVAYSSKNATFLKGENILNFAITSDATLRGGNIVLSDVLLSLKDDQSFNGSDLSITVPSFIGVESISVTPSSASVNLGSTLTLSAEVAPATAWVKKVTWTSSNTSVATVDDNGVVTPVGKGSATITATATDGTGVTGTAQVTVTNYMQSLTLDSSELTIEEDETLQLNPTFAPANSDEVALAWTTTDASVAYVDDSNLLHALTPGTATVTAHNAASGLSASIEVTVTAVLYGDSNDNGEVAINDVVTDVQYILEQNPNPFSFKKADVNRDRKINIIDVSKTVTIVLTNSSAGVSRRVGASYAMENAEDKLSSNEVIMDELGNGEMVLTLGDIADITAMQADLILPQGVAVTGMAMATDQTGDHVVDYADIDDNEVRFVIYSLSLDRMAENMPMIKINLTCDNDFESGIATMGDIFASDTDCDMRQLKTLNVVIKREYTGVDSIADDENGKPVDIYNFQGICLKRNATQHDIDSLAPGLYIIGSKKVIVK